MRTSILILLAVCVTFTVQQSSCVTGLESVIGDAIKAADAVKERNILEAIEDVTQFIQDFETKVEGQCKNLTIPEIKQIVDTEVTDPHVKQCLDDICQTAEDAKELIHDIHHHEILHIIKYAAKTADDFLHIRNDCKREN